MNRNVFCKANTNDVRCGLRGSVSSGDHCKNCLQRMCQIETIREGE